MNINTYHRSHIKRLPAKMADQDIEYFDDINENKSLTTLRKVLSFVALAYTASSPNQSINALSDFSELK